MAAPHLVLITADQWRGDCLSGVGSRHPVMTPHMSQIGCEGVRFAQAYADCPICMPQRVTTLTGQVASRFGKTSNFADRSPIDPAASLPGRLSREAGYQTKAIGKMHLEPSRMRAGFEHIELHPNDYVNWLETQGWGGGYRGHGLGGNEVYPTVSAVPERFTHTHWIIDRAVDFLGARDPECPFFLWLVFEAPHSPFDPPAPYDRMYDNIPIPEPLRAAWADEAPPEFAYRRAMYKYDHLTPAMEAEARRKYYGQVSHIDYQLGRFLGELKTRGLYDDTAIVFTADHGEHLGDHGIWAKSTYLHGSGDVPLQFKPPKGTGPAGLVCDRPVLTADICPTFLELAGLTPGPDCDGVSLTPVARGETDAAPFATRVICGEHAGSAFAHDGRHKYIYYAQGAVEQLFDVEEDPENLRDLSKDPAQGETLARLRTEVVAQLGRHGEGSRIVKGGALVTQPPPSVSSETRGLNPYAWRGPMHHGQGYNGWKG